MRWNVKYKEISWESEWVREMRWNVKYKEISWRVRRTKEKKKRKVTSRSTE